MEYKISQNDQHYKKRNGKNLREFMNCHVAVYLSKIRINLQGSKVPKNVLPNWIKD